MCCLVLITSIVLIAVSVKKLETYEVGLSYNPTTVSLDRESLLQGGTHLLTPGHVIYVFDKNLRTVVMGSQGSDEADLTVSLLEARTKDALEVDIQCSFQYKVSTELGDLLFIFDTWGEEYEAGIIRIARNVLRDSMAKFGALEVFYNRTTVELTMRTTLQEKMLEQKITVESFQLLDIELPGTLNQALIDTEDLNLQIETVKFEQEEETEKAIGQVNKAVTDAQVIVNEADGYYSRAVSAGESKSQSIQAKMNQAASSLGALKTTLRMTALELAKFYFYENIDFNTLSNVKYNLEQPSSIQCIYDSSIPC